MSKSAAADPESTGKDLFRHAWSYAQKLDQAYKSGGDVFHLDIIALRTKIKQKCEQILVLSCSQRRKAEEILWKKVFYEVISYCKQHKLFDPAHPLHPSCHTHLMTACMFYQHQLQWLPEHYGWDIMSCDPTQLEEKASTNTDLQWLLEACQRCLVYLGDIARYQIDLGGSPEEAVLYYQQAIVLDPTNGAPFNQLAVLAENKHHVMAAAYYYMRSITSLHPFPVSEANLKRLFNKNAKTLKAITDAEERKTEPDLRQHQTHSLQSSIVQLHNEFQSATAKGSTASIPLLCSRIMTSLEECLNADCAEIASSSQSGSHGAQSGNEAAILSSRDILVLCGLTILPAYNLRLKGSKDTLAASAFALSVFSLFLDFSYQQLMALASKHSDKQRHHSADTEKERRTLLELLTPSPDDTPTTSTPPPALQTVIPEPTDKNKVTGQSNGADKPRSLRSRRRRKKGGARSARRAGSDDTSDDTNSAEESDSCSVESLEEEEDDNKMASLSLSSSDSSSDEQTLAPSLPQSSGTPRGRRTFQLAANFSTAVSLGPSESKAISKPSSDTLRLSLASHDQSCDDRQLAKLYQDTKEQEIVHNACGVVARCHLMGGVKVLTDWLQCYPTVIATYAKSSATSVWSRLAELLNFLPSVEALRQTGLIDSNDISGWTQSQALHEDSFLRGFAPLLRKQQTLTFPSASESINKELVPSQQQGAILILSLIKFGHYVANSKTTPVFEFDPTTDRFMGPAQHERMLAVAAAELKLKEEEKAWANRTKLMKAMAEQKLKSEVSALAAKTKAQRTKALFTPYLLPDAATLCSGLHLIKKLLKTEKFVVVIASSVIETLDQMKKGKESYAAREAIKFLERQLHAGNRFVRAQKAEETASPDRKRPYKQELAIWLFSCLVDCAVYFNTTPLAGSDGRGGGALATLLLARNIIGAVNPSHHRVVQQPDPEVVELAELAVTARQSGVELDTLVHFHKRWTKQS